MHDLRVMKAANMQSRFASACRCFVAGGHWRAAVAVAAQSGTAEAGTAILRGTLAPAAASAAQERLQEAWADAERITKYCTRLQAVRQRREALAAAVGARLL